MTDRKINIMIVVMLLLGFAGLADAEKYAKKSDTEVEISEITVPPISVTISQLESARDHWQGKLDLLESQYLESKERITKERDLAIKRIEEAAKLGVLKEDKEVWHE